MAYADPTGLWSVGGVWNGIAAGAAVVAPIAGMAAPFTGPLAPVVGGVAVAAGAITAIDSAYDAYQVCSGNEKGSCAGEIAIGAIGIAAGGLGASALKSGMRRADFTRVGRWMSPDEHALMRKTGNVQWNPTSGTHRVSNPATPHAYRDAPDGDIYAEYEVPASALRPHSDGTSIIYGPNSLQARLPGRAQTGDVPFLNMSDPWSQ